MTVARAQPFHRIARATTVAWAMAYCINFFCLSPHYSVLLIAIVILRKFLVIRYPSHLMDASLLLIHYPMKIAFLCSAAQCMWMSRLSASNASYSGDMRKSMKGEISQQPIVWKRFCIQSVLFEWKYSIPQPWVSNYLLCLTVSVINLDCLF